MFGIEMGLLTLWLGLSVFVIKSNVDDESVMLGVAHVVLRQVLRQTNQLNKVKPAEVCGTFA